MTIEFDKFKKVFIEKREVLINSLKGASVEIDVDGDEVDEASAGTIGSISANLSKRSMRQIEDIDKALRRIEEGTFGECEECGEDIGDRRLFAKPDALTCIGCAERLESITKQFAR